MKFKLILILSLVMKGSAGMLFAQSLSLGVLPMQYNPSFAGSSGAPRISVVGNYQDYGLLKNYNTAFSYDNFSTKLSTGFGFSANYSNIQRQNDINNYYNREIITLSGIVAPKISINGKYTLSPSMGFQYVNKQPGNIENNIIFFTVDSNDTKYRNFSIQAGLLFNTEKYYIGLAYFGKGFSSQRDPGNIYQYTSSGTMVFTGGYVFKRRPDSKFSFTPSVRLSFYKPVNGVYIGPKFFNLSDINIMLNFRYKKFIAGIANGIMVGYQDKNIRISYTLNSLSTYNSKIKTGSELSIRLNLNKQKNKLSTLRD